MSNHIAVVSTKGMNETLTIGMSFVVLAYFLHPMVEAAYERVRAYRAWRAIEKRKSVEVTSYPLVSQVFGRRRNWDAARVVAIVLAAFSLASWGLELSVGLAIIDEGGVDLLQRPPPVFQRTSETSGRQPWQVESRDSIFGFENGLVQNMFGDMKRGDAKSRYHVHNKRHPEVNGGILVASWSDKAMDAPSLFYGAEDNASAIIGSLECSKGSVTLHDADVYVGDGDTSWGTVLECAEGPSVTNTNETSLPTIILSRGSKRYIIVEESSSYPNFMYSVWTTDSRTDADVKIQHEFHISSSMRLAEAVVTGIVQAAQNEEEPTGGGCFSLLRQYSENNVGYSDELERASPFGEHPSGDFSGIKSLSEVESVVDGIGLNVNALMCVVWLIVVTLIGVAWSYFLSFSIGMDIYNRDELIRAVSIQDPPSSGGPSSDIRIFVHRKDTGHIGVVIRDSGEERGGCLQFFNRRAKQVKPVLAAATTAMPETDCPPSTPAPSVRAFALGAIRLGMERSMPGRDGNYCYPTTSPVDSEIFLEETPVPNLSILTPTVPNSDFLGKRGASALFDNSMHSTSFATSFQSEGDTETGLVKHEGVT